MTGSILDQEIEILQDAEDDVLKRFMRSLPPNVRLVAEETIRIREQFMRQTQALLCASNCDEALQHAEWIRNNVFTVAYHWPRFMREVARWAERECPPLRIKVTKPDADDGGGK